MSSASSASSGSSGDNKGRFQKGSSGNPGGRPATRRALAAQILTTSEEAVYSERTNRELLAKQIWQGLVTGRVELIGGVAYELTVKEWLELVKWAHQHVDGTLPAHYSASPQRSTLSFDEKAHQQIEHAEALLATLQQPDQSLPDPVPDELPDPDEPPYDHEQEYQRLSAEVMANQRETLRDEWMRQILQNRSSNI